MNKNIIYFEANEQCLIRTGTENFASDTVSYIEADFALRPNWSGFDSVRAVWSNGWETVATVLDRDGVTIVPQEVLTRRAKVMVNLVGSVAENGTVTDRLTSHQIEALDITDKVLLTGTETAPITPSQFEQFVAIVHDEVEEVTGMSAEATTLPAGSEATASYSDGVLSFGIPKGDKGEQGERGPQGVQGPKGEKGEKGDGSYDDTEVRELITAESQARAGADTILTDEVEKLSTYVTPEMFGAKGDGVTDDTDAFISCFDSVVNGGIVLIPAKRYKLSDCITVKGNTNIICHGRINYTLESTNQGKGLFEFSGDNILWQGGSFIGTGALTAYAGFGCVFHSASHSNIKIEDVKIYDTPCTYAIMFEDCNYINIDNAYVNEYTYGGICFNEACKNSIIQNCVVLHGNDVSHDNRYPISLSLYANATSNMPLATNISILNNYIEDASPFWEGIDAHGGTQLKIIGNVIKNTFFGITLAADTGKYDCNDIVISDNIIILPQSGATASKNNNGITLNTCNNVGISNNIIKNAGFLVSNVKIGCGFSLTRCTNVVANNNHIKNCNGDAIYMYASNHIIINDNNIEGNSTTSQFFIEYVGTNTKTTAKNNIISKYPRGVYGGTGDGSTRNYLKGNKYDKLDMSNVNYIIPDILPLQGLIANIKTGDVGDIILNGQAGAGKPFGWICTTEGTSSADAVWTALANL